ncbi:zinc-dependent metalloprotease [Halorarum salinum]|uniref:Zinc-dependent metalloprotease n=1 Tax=Halorarum salinum TaxID=2743089 RepID=A0A7D5LBL2_9EURY|nr:zinc-dependent metalloprotease [Halobaculum salinum]QLG62690.1 zinc-dependent metalloprotease [Halobaculum salinum]
MDIARSMRALADAADAPNGVVDWDAVAEAAKGAVDPGDVRVEPAEREAIAADVRAARDGLRAASGVSFDLPDSVEVQSRHHWIDANVATFERVLRPLERRGGGVFPGVARSVNTGTMAVAVAFLARNVLGQYDPLLLADGAGPGAAGGPNAARSGGHSDHGLYFVRPNIRRVAAELDVDYPRFRRWIAFHEVAHAAEFAAAPWLSTYLEERMEEGVEALSEGSLSRESFAELNTAMTAVEGYAELLMDHAFDGEYEELRVKLDERRGGGDPLTRLLKRALGFEMKREQYERGAAFFEAVADETGVATTTLVWDAPENLPTEAELDDPGLWLDRVARA